MGYCTSSFTTPPHCLGAGSQGKARFWTISPSVETSQSISEPGGKRCILIGQGAQLFFKMNQSSTSFSGHPSCCGTTLCRCCCFLQQNRTLGQPRTVLEEMLVSFSSLLKNDRSKKWAAETRCTLDWEVGSALACPTTSIVLSHSNRKQPE